MLTSTIKKNLLAASAVLLLSSLFSVTESRHCSILQVHGANHKTGTGFGIVTDGSVPRTGSGGDAGADATAFSAGNNPNPACGRVAKLQGNIVNIADQTTKAIALGLPTVYANGSIPLTVFQVDRPGGGPMTCEYSADATGNSWQAMDVTLNMPGNFGILAADRTQYMVIATFKAGSQLTGGANRNTGVVRCRAGQQGLCGGCFAVQMDGQVVKASGGSSSAAPAAATSSDATLSLTSQQMSALMSKVITLAKGQHLVADSKTKN